MSESLDLAVVKIPGAKAPALMLGHDADVAVGDDVYVVGNPRGLEGTLSQGIVSAIRSTPERRLLQITAPISPGSSGGPVLNSEGKVIGVAVSTLRDSQNLNFAVSVGELRQLVNQVGAVRPFPATTGSARRSATPVTPTPPATAPVAPAPPVIATPAPPSISKPKTRLLPDDIYETAYLDFRKGAYELAIVGFREFLRRNPRHDLAGNAQYWIGEAHFNVARNHAAAGLIDRATVELEWAVRELHKVTTDYPRGEKTPAALYKEALGLIELKQPALARQRLQYLIENFPQAEEIPLARARLTVLKES
jgi:TolA-binding protein